MSAEEFHNRDWLPHAQMARFLRIRQDELYRKVLAGDDELIRYGLSAAAQHV